MGLDTVEIFCMLKCTKGKVETSHIVNDLRQHITEKGNRSLKAKFWHLRNRNLKKIGMAFLNISH